MKRFQFKLGMVLSCFVTISFLTSLGASAGYKKINFVTVLLPYGVSIDLSEEWSIKSYGQRIHLEKTVGSMLDLAGLTGVEKENSDIHFAGEYYLKGKANATVNIRYYSHLGLTQKDAAKIRAEDVEELIKESAIDSLLKLGATLIEWKGTEKVIINGITAFITEYKRGALPGSGSFRVRLIRVFAGKQSFTLTVSYNEKDALFFEIVTDAIIDSLKIKGIY